MSATKFHTHKKTGNIIVLYIEVGTTWVQISELFGNIFQKNAVSNCEITFTPSHVHENKKKKSQSD